MGVSPVWGTATNFARLPKAVQDIIRQSSIPKEAMSIWIAPINHNLPVIDWQSDIARKPASVIKVITTGIGLLLLGEDYRWRTEFYTNGRIENSILKGDLFIKGYGDPYMVEEQLLNMVIELRDLGINHIDGQIILDSSYFIRHPEDPDAFDGHGMEKYNAIPNALNVNFHTLKLVFTAEKKNVEIATDPALSYFKIDNQIKLSNRKKCTGKGFAPQLMLDKPNRTLIVSGSISHHCKNKVLKRVLGDAGDLFFGYFERAWLLTGGTLSGKWLYGQRPKNATKLHVGYSKPLYEQIAAMNKNSNNVMTRQLFLTIGAELTQPPGTLTKSRAVVKNRLKKMGINLSGAFIDNGAGLSRQSRLTAKQLGLFMQGMQTNPNVATFFEQSLSIVGVDGTLKRRLRNTPLAGNAIGKSGTLDGVKTLTGYLTAKSGKKFAYVIMLEGNRAKLGRPLMDDLMQWIYHEY